MGRDKHKLVGPRRRVSTQTKDGLCLGGARREDGAVTLEPDSRRERGVRARVGGLDPTPPPLGRAGRRGPGYPDGSRGPDQSGRTCDISPGAACRCAGLPSPSRLAFTLNLRGGSSCSPLRFCWFGGLSVEFPRYCVPLPTKSVPRGHFLKTGGIEKHDILGNLVNSRLVSFHFLKNHNL